MAIQFNGIGDYGVTGSDLTLSGFDKGVVLFWLWFDSYSNSDQIAIEMGGNANAFAGRIYLNPDGSTATGLWEILAKNTGGSDLGGFARPSAAAWHHIAVELDWTTTAAVAGIRVDNVAATWNDSGDGGTAAGAFRDDPWFCGARAGTSLFSGMRLEDWAIFGGKTFADLDMAAIYAGTAADAGVTPTFRWPLLTDGTASDGGINLTLTGTTVVDGPHPTPPPTPTVPVPTRDMTQYALIDIGSSGNNVLVSGVPGMRIVVNSFSYVVAGPVTVTYKSGTTALSGAMPMGDTGQIPGDRGGSNKRGWCATAPGEDFVIHLSDAVACEGSMTYTLK